jgi:Ca-activated chloride channel family protein
MTEFHFLRPYWLLALPPVVILWWTIWCRQDRVAAWSRVVDPHLLKHLLVGRRARARLRPVHLLLAAWLVAVIAVSGPTWRRKPAPFADDKAGLVVLLKVSGTMNATDVQPTRLERAKHKLRDLLAQREGAATGLVVYSGSAHLVMPLTRDHRIITAMIEDLTPDLMPADGDALAEAVEAAETLFARAGTSGSVVVMADGIATAQVDAIRARPVAIPVQVLAVQAASAPIDAGTERLAGAIRAPLERLTVDQADVERLARRARSRIASVDAESDPRWRDDGYSLVPLVALCALAWSRKGWVIC